MRKTLTVWLLIGPLGALIAGCGASFSKTKEERSHQWETIAESEWGMAADDLDAFLLAERRSRLSKWH